MIKMIAFDLDGTIGETIPMCIKSFEQAVSPYAGHKLSREEIVQTFGLNELGMIKKVVRDHWEEALEDFYNIYEKRHAECPCPYNGIVELILFLQSRRIATPLITGKGERSCHITLQKFGMQYLFSPIRTGTEDRNNKAESIHELLFTSGVPKDEFYYVGDALSDITACREAGVQCLSAAWSETADIDRLRQANPHYVFLTIKGLHDFFASRFANFHLQA